MDRASDDEASYKKRLPIMQPINLAWISSNKLLEKMDTLEMVDATKTHAGESDLERMSFKWT